MIGHHVNYVEEENQICDFQLDRVQGLVDRPYLLGQLTNYHRVMDEGNDEDYCRSMLDK